MAGPAGAELPLQRRGDHGGQPRHLQERHQGDGAAERPVGHLHGQARSHLDRQLVPHPLEPLGRRRGAVLRRVAAVQAVPRRHVANAGEFAVFLAPNINSYKRYAAGSWAPTTLAWGYDNRTCGFRVVGHGKSLRVECRIPGADANPYLAFAALLAAGLHGIEQQLELPPRLHRQRVRVRRQAISAHAQRGDQPRSSTARSRARRSATTSSTTTSTTRAPSSSSSTRWSPATSASASSSADDTSAAEPGHGAARGRARAGRRCRDRPRGGCGESGVPGVACGCAV